MVEVRFLLGPDVRDEGVGLGVLGGHFFPTSCDAVFPCVFSWYDDGWIFF